MKEHEIRELVNQLRDIAIEYRDTQQLREHISHAVSAAIKPVTLINEGNIQSGNSGQVPSGYVLVPVEPTDLMVEAMYRNQLSMRGALKAAIAAAPAISGGWIPVSERMPEENAEKEVLACFKGGDISTLYYFEGRWDDAYGIVPIRQDVTHWQPLPNPPEE